MPAPSSRAPVHLLVDGLFLRPGEVGGVEFMLYSLLAGLVAAREAGDRVTVLVPEGVDLGGRPFAAALDVVPVSIEKNRFVTVERRLSAEHGVPDHDVALFPNYYTPWAAGRRRRPRVTVVHDLQFRSFPQNFTVAKRAFLNVALRATASRATTVVAISDFTAGELAAFRPGVEARLEVVPNPIDWARFDTESPPEDHDDLEDEPFFLLTAAQYRHKNIATALEAFARVRDRHRHARLVLVGQVPDGLGETRRSAALPRRPGVEQLGFVPDAVLAWLYRRATAVLLPSLYEGCGLPAAEALGLGTPVLHSGRGAIPEVAGRHGVAVGDPLAADDWADLMARAVAGDLPRPDAETVASVRATHDVEVIGRRYWEVVAAASRRGGDPAVR